MEFDTIIEEDRDSCRVLTLNRPDVMNALNSQMRAELTYALREAHADARVVVIRGTGRAFCSGQDLGDRERLSDLDLERTLRDEYLPMLSAIVECPVPVIAAVNGTAAGAGANLALVCDVTIAAKSAVFVQAFSRIGLIPDVGGTWVLPRMVGLQRAMGAALFAERIPAEKAESWGMIWEAVEDDAFEACWQMRAAQIASGPSEAFKRTKLALRESFSNDFDEQVALESKLQGECGKTRDFKEGVLAFLEKRSASFEGR